MEAEQLDVGGFVRTVARIVGFRRATAKGRDDGVESGAATLPDDGAGAKIGSSQYMEGKSVLSRSGYGADDEEKRLQQRRRRRRETMESLVAELFTRISAIKAAYAQLQVAESPYDPDAVQSADAVVVSELRRLSQLKASHLKRRVPVQASAGDAKLLAEAQEQRNLLKTFQITAKKLESELRRRDSAVLLLKNQLAGADAATRGLEEKLHPGRTLRVFGGLHLSALNPTHFLVALRYVVRSARAFAALMAKEMERAGWDLSAAAAAIAQDNVRPQHQMFAFQSYVARAMFSDFQSPDFGVGGGGAPLHDRRRFFEDFSGLKSADLGDMLRDQKGESPFAVFCRAKYLNLVHPRMEGSFFGNLNQRGMVNSGRGFPGTEFFLGFAEVARRVWLLHRLFFSFDPEARTGIFQLQRGCRFSEVYMESVVDDGETWSPVVGFTVVPGFVVGKTVIQCRIYPAAM